MHVYKVLSSPPKQLGHTVGHKGQSAKQKPTEKWNKKQNKTDEHHNKSV